MMGGFERDRTSQRLLIGKYGLLPQGGAALSPSVSESKAPSVPCEFEGLFNAVCA